MPAATTTSPARYWRPSHQSPGTAIGSTGFHTTAIAPSGGTHHQ